MFLVANRGWEGTKAGLWEGDFAGVGDIKEPACEDTGQHSRMRESSAKALGPVGLACSGKQGGR